MEVSGQLHAPVALPPRERAPGTHWIGGWVGLRAVLKYILLISSLDITDRPVPVASRSKPSTVFDRSNTEIAGSNPTRGMDVCPHFSVLCCPV
jgi:hypothetical protein